MLIKEWPRFTAQEKTRCAEEANDAGPPSYVEWLTSDSRKLSAVTTPGAGTGGETGSENARRNIIRHPSLSSAHQASARFTIVK
jgi:hypothetical protein